MEPPKFYCPYCQLELSGNGHKNDNQAWYLFNCDYNPASDKMQPIPELEIQKRRIVELRAKKDKLELTIQATVDRIAQLDTGCAEEPPSTALSEEENHVCRRWFDSLQDMHPAYLGVRDYVLAAKLYQRCGMRIPNSITSKLPKESADD